jgi:phenylalanyl-tRNA synthetase beta subunit
LNETPDTLELEVPYFRTDIEVEDDIVSDVLRINDYNNIPNELINTAPPKEVTPKIVEFEEKVRDLLVSLGLHEHITSPLTEAHGGKADQIVLENSLNSEQDALRTNIYETLYPIVELYKKHKNKRIGVFEVGRTYSKDIDTHGYEGLKETNVVEGIFWNEGEMKDINSEMKKALGGLLLGLGIKNTSYKMEEEEAVIYQGQLKLGTLRIDSFTLYTENLMQASSKQLRVLDHIVHKSYEDVTLEVERGVHVGEIIDEVLKKSNNIDQIEKVDEFKKGNSKAITLRLHLETQ